MLVLTRQKNQSILIGKNIRITILAVVGSHDEPRVKIGIKAPATVRVDREELRRRIVAEGVIAS